MFYNVQHIRNLGFKTKIVFFFLNQGRLVLFPHCLLISIILELKICTVSQTVHLISKLLTIIVQIGFISI